MQNRLIAPSTNFAAVRDGRNSQVFYVDIALDTARSAAAGTGLVLPISGNAFYCDANPSDGNAYVHFQDTNFDRGPVPLYVSPGVIFNIPFTQVLIENTAQPGKKIRIAYGIDVDFQPGSVAQIAVTNAGGYTAVRPEQSTNFWVDTSIVVANTALTVFTPAQNPNGVILLSAQSTEEYTTGFGLGAFIAHTSAPANVTTGEIMAILQYSGIITGARDANCSLNSPQFIAAGKGLYYISQFAASTNGMHAARWKAL